MASDSDSTSERDRELQEIARMLSRQEHQLLLQAVDKIPATALSDVYEIASQVERGAKGEIVISPDGIIATTPNKPMVRLQAAKLMGSVASKAQTLALDAARGRRDAERLELEKRKLGEFALDSEVTILLPDWATGRQREEGVAGG